MNETLSLSLHITRRNWTVYKKDFIANISPTISDPIFMMFSLGVGLGGFIPEIEAKSYLQYLAPGLAASTALLTSFFETSWGFYVRMTYENVFKAMLTTPIGVREVALGEFIWVALKGGIMTIGTALVFMCFGLYSNPVTLPLAFVVGVLIALSCGAIGLIASCLVRNINQFQTIYSFIISPLFFFSGIFYPFDKMPPVLQQLSFVLPLSHGVLMGQSLFWNQNILQTFLVHGGVLIVQSVVLCLIAYRLLIRKLQG